MPWAKLDALYLISSGVNQGWRALNPVHNNYTGVQWLSEFNEDGGAQYTETSTVSMSTSSTRTVTLDLPTEVVASVEFLDGSLTFELTKQNYNKTGYGCDIKTSYTIFDDESTDHISQDVGIDPTFGTFIFRPRTFFSNTSEPFEHDTTDYIAPLIGMPTINLDPSGDGIAPGGNDAPVITVTIYEEATVASAKVWYDDGNGLYTAILTELVASPGTWRATIPARPHGTTVQWWIFAVDVEGNVAIRRDVTGLNFSYTVLNRNPVISWVYPNGGEQFYGMVPVSWSALDPDGDTLMANISYNRNNLGWNTVVTGWSGASYDWNASTIADSASFLIRVRVYDGLGGIALMESDQVFTIATHNPTGSIIINGGNAFTTSPTVSLTLSSFSAIEMRFSTEGITWTSWEAFATARTFEVPSGDGFKTVRVQLRDQFGLVSLVQINDSITLDTTLPTGSFSINNNATFTMTGTVTLHVSGSDASGVTNMRISNDGVLWGGWEPFSITRQLDLQGGEGTKSVYVQLRDAAGLESIIMSDSIIYSTIDTDGDGTPDPVDTDDDDDGYSDQDERDQGTNPLDPGDNPASVAQGQLVLTLILTLIVAGATVAVTTIMLKKNVLKTRRRNP